MTSRFHTTPELIFPDFITYITHWLRRPWDIFQAFSPESLVKAMESFECGFGRMETIETDGKTIKVILVKNPTGLIRF